MSDDKLKINNKNNIFIKTLPTIEEDEFNVEHKNQILTKNNILMETELYIYKKKYEKLHDKYVEDINISKTEISFWKHNHDSIAQELNKIKENKYDNLTHEKNKNKMIINEINDYKNQIDNITKKYEQLLLKEKNLNNKLSKENKSLFEELHILKNKVNNNEINSNKLTKMINNLYENEDE